VIIIVRRNAMMIDDDKPTPSDMSADEIVDLSDSTRRFIPSLPFSLVLKSA